jgi:plasmid stabilization system protein ParE
MDFKVIFRETFLEDLEGIIARIAGHDPSAARRLGETIIATAESLCFFPERYPKLRQRTAIRRFIVGRHFKVFYRVLLKPKVVEILRCWDGRRRADPSC